MEKVLSSPHSDGWKFLAKELGIDSLNDQKSSIRKQNAHQKQQQLIETLTHKTTAADQHIYTTYTSNKTNTNLPLFIPF